MTIGILGGGQLGRMLALAGYRLGLRFRVLDPADDVSAGHVAEHIQGGYDDPAAWECFVQGLDLITYEFENVPLPTVHALGMHAPVYPPPAALETAQDRLVEKRFFQKLDIPTPPFTPVDTRAELEDAVRAMGLPAVLKTRRFGYDGKGQRLIRSGEELADAWAQLGGQPLLLEGYVPFERELSILAARARSGATTFYPLVQNEHRDGILRLSIALAPGRSLELQREAERMAARVLLALNYVGVIAIELFQVGNSLIANEMAPRVHNSGHWTIEGASTSQFENHLRAMLDLPLGSTESRDQSAMLNIIGIMPDSAAALAIPGAQLHLYGKSPRPGRKLGHITITAPDQQKLKASIEQLGRLVNV